MTQKLDILHRGKVLRLKRTGVVVALLERASKSGWDCVVVGGNSETYKPGGYDIFVFDEDLREGQEIELA